MAERLCGTIAYAPIETGVKVEPYTPTMVGTTRSPGADRADLVVRLRH
jgi:hypothetical protein